MPAPEDEPETTPRRGRLVRLTGKIVLPLVLFVAVAIALAYTVFPTRTWLDQRESIAQGKADLAELETLNMGLHARLALLATDAEIERIARADLGLVRPGEEAYAVLPAAPEPVRIPPSWPFTELAGALE